MRPTVLWELTKISTTIVSIVIFTVTLALEMQMFALNASMMLTYMRHGASHNAMLDFMG